MSERNVSTLKGEGVMDVRETILTRLAEGDSLSRICKHQDMPDRRTIQRWQDEDANFDAAVTRAREEGYHKLAEAAVDEATGAKDAALGRLAFDARRWYLGKLSNAFSDNKAQKHEVTHGLTDEAAEWLGLTSSS